MAQGIPIPGSSAVQDPSGNIVTEGAAPYPPTNIRAFTAPWQLPAPVPPNPMDYLMRQFPNYAQYGRMPIFPPQLPPRHYQAGDLSRNYVNPNQPGGAAYNRRVTFAQNLGNAVAQGVNYYEEKKARDIAYDMQRVEIATQNNQDPNISDEAKTANNKMIAEILYKDGDPAKGLSPRGKAIQKSLDFPIPTQGEDKRDNVSKNAFQKFMGRAFGKRQPQQIQQAAPAQIAPQTTAASATVQQPPMNLPGQPISIMGQPTTPGPGISLPGQPTTARLAGTPLQNRQALAQQQMLAGMPTGLHLNPTAAIDAQLAQMGLRPMADKMVDFIVQNSHDVTKLESLNRMMGNRLDIATLQYVARQGHDATLRYIARTVAGWQGARTQMIGSVADLRARFLSEDKADQARLKTIQDGITSANKILQNPKATAEAKATAQSQLNDLYARQTGIYQEIANRMREMNQAQWGAMSPFLGEQQPSDMTPDDLEIVRSLYQD